MILITYPKIIRHEHEWIHLFFEHGLQTLHVRKPGLSLEELKEYISWIDPKYHNRLMLHSHIRLVEEFGLMGISFTEATKPQHSKYADLKIKRCWATHSIEELNHVPDDIDYAFLSPLFPSISKKGYARSWEISDLATYQKRHEKRFSLVALGGIDPLNFGEALKIGFDDVAVLGCLWEPVINGAEKEEVLDIFNQLNSMSSSDFSPLYPLKGEAAEPLPRNKSNNASLAKNIDDALCRSEKDQLKIKHQSTDFQCSPLGVRGKEH